MSLGSVKKDRKEREMCMYRRTAQKVQQGKQVWLMKNQSKCMKTIQCECLCVFYDYNDVLAAQNPACVNEQSGEKQD